MNHHIDDSFTDCLMNRCIIDAHHSFQAEWALNSRYQLRCDLTHEIIQIVLPHPVISQTVAPSAAGKQIAFIQIVHADIVKTLTDREPFSKHKQTGCG